MIHRTQSQILDNQFIKTFLSTLLVLAGLASAFSAQAIPSFSRQTGAACSQCHVQAFGPNLTQFGRDFKLSGYTMKSPDAKLAFPPFSAQMQGSFTHTGKGRAGGAAPDFGSNDNASFDGASILYGGRVLPNFGNLGAFMEVHFDGVEKQWSLDNTDIRLADTLRVAGKDVILGISVNNNPTVQDLWNTTPAWGYPFVASGLAPTPATAALIDGALGGQVIGSTVYLMWNHVLYLEAGAYTSLPKGTQQIIGTFASDESQISGGAPYWRVALQHDWHGHYLAVGTYGLTANVFPGRDHTAGTDGLTDIGVDWTYQYLGTGKHIFELKGTYLNEDQSLRASQTLAGSNRHNTLESFRINGAYTFLQTYGVTLGYFRTTGSRDQGLYSPGEITGSTNGRPDSEGFIAELDYIPFGKQISLLAPWLNLRLALQYAGYLQFNGAGSNYDGFGRNASDNNTLFLNSWLTF